MASLFTRFWNLVRGKGNALLNRLEDPGEQLSVFVSELDTQVQELQRAVTAAIADEKRLHMQLEALRARTTDWEQRALTALEEGDEELARAAVVRQEECEVEVATLETGWLAQKDATERLVESLKLAKGRMDEARRHYNLLLARYRSAQTRKKIQGSLARTPSDSPLEMMEQLEERIRQVEAEAEAQLAIDAPGVDVDVEARFREIDVRRRGDEALSRLKSRMAEERGIAPTSEAASRVESLKRELDS